VVLAPLGVVCSSFVVFLREFASRLVVCRYFFFLAVYFLFHCRFCTYAASSCFLAFFSVILRGSCLHFFLILGGPNTGTALPTTPPPLTPPPPGLVVLVFFSTITNDLRNPLPKTTFLRVVSNPN